MCLLAPAAKSTQGVAEAAQVDIKTMFPQTAQNIAMPTQICLFLRFSAQNHSRGVLKVLAIMTSKSNTAPVDI